MTPFHVQDLAVGVLGYFLFGWAFAYGDNTVCNDDGVCTSVQNPFIGSTQFAMHDLPATSYHTWFFQYVFAISTATIVSGAVAERITMLTYVLCEPPN
jgi:Amt family ammonium transporter